MTNCIYCIDNDVLQKLATLDLFSETIALFSVNFEQVRILETAKYKFQKDYKKLQAGKTRKPENKTINYQEVIALAEKLPVIKDINIDQSIFDSLVLFNEIDVGEATLTAYVAQLIQKQANSEAVIFTGDKRYLKALAQAPLPLVKEKLSHRFWCLEQLILRDIKAYSFEKIRDKIVPFRDCDKALKSVFGSGSLATQDNALLTLQAYIAELRAETASLLHPYPNVP